MTGTVPLVSGDTGGKKGSIRTDPSTPGVRLWALLWGEGDSPGVRIKPFPIKLPFAAAAYGSNPSGSGGCGSRWHGGLGEEPAALHGQQAQRAALPIR